MKPRAEVREFARHMEAKLRENDHKGGWNDCERGWLLRRLGQEVGELRRALRANEQRLQRAAWTDIGRDASRRRIAREAADVANFAMMIADASGALNRRAR